MYVSKCEVFVVPKSREVVVESSELRSYRVERDVEELRRVVRGE